MFQSTRPRGARLVATLYYLDPYGFQSTRPRGARLASSMQAFSYSLVSIHAPARGATDMDPTDIPDTWVSIHAPARGATAALKRENEKIKVSIHAPARGATRLEVWSSHTTGVSIHRARAGRDLGLVPDRLRCHKFQSTRPRGARL